MALSLERLEDLVGQATDPTRRTTDLAVTLEICDWVKSKTNGPVFLTESLFKRIHSKNLQPALLALQVLDSCVKNCGVPFHLHIATKKFLNELVRYFPERPPTPRSPLIDRILELIQLWHYGLVPKSRHKNELTNISEMYKLLKSKGYSFPKFKESEAALIISDPALLTEEELEKEDHAAQAAKLDELLRRGTPEDLEAANQLMKLLAGYDPDTKPNYKGQVDDQLKKIEKSCQELLDLVRSIPPEENLSSYQLLDELAGKCKSSQPKIQSFINEEEDADRIEKLLALNDRINSALTGYEALRNHQPIPQEILSSPSASSAAASASPQPSSKPATATTTATTATVTASLLDLDLDFSSSSASASTSAYSNVLGGFNNNNNNQNGFAYPQQQQQQPSIPLIAPPPSYSAPSYASQDTFASFPPAPQTAFPPSQSAFAPISASLPAFAPAVSSQPAFPPAQATLPAFAPITPSQQPFQSASATPSAFAPIQPSPAAFAPVQASQPAFPPLIQPPPQQQTPLVPVSAASASTSAAITSTVHNVTVFQNEALLIQAQLEKKDDLVTCVMSVSNKLNSPITNLNVQLAVPKTQRLKLEPLSSSNVAPLSMGGRPVTQNIVIENPSRVAIRIRFRISYDVSGKQNGVVEQGEFSNIPAFYG